MSIQQLLLFFVKSSISVSVVFIFYRLLLRRHTFYSWNRWYLLGYGALSFVFPFINISPLFQQTSEKYSSVHFDFPTVGNYTSILVSDTMCPIPLWSTQWSKLDWIFLFCAAGMFFFLVRFLIRCFSLWNLQRAAHVIEGNGVKIYQVNRELIPFSFGNAIYANPHMHSETEWDEIILHEYVHVKQRHTIDLLFSEFLCIFNWFNPLAWMLRRDIRQNLEFIADEQVIQKGINKRSYQYHLLKVVGSRAYRIANHFNISSLKKRIAMMNKIKSAKIHLLRFLFLLPLLAVLLLAFRDKVKFSKPENAAAVYHDAGIVMDAVSLEPLAGVTVRENVSGVSSVTDEKGFFKLEIPLLQNITLIELRLSKNGYEEGSQHANLAQKEKRNSGAVELIALLKKTPVQPGKAIYRAPFISSQTDLASEDPGYSDALKVYRNYVYTYKGFNEMMNWYKRNPEILFVYTTEGKEKQIVIFKDRSYRQFGYPGTSGIDEMEKKYGVLPVFMKKDEHPVNAEYLAKWKAISEEAVKHFVTSDKKAKILFPGDSRVLVIPQTGKPNAYDMDNASPEERPAFEKLYGPLPAVVPQPDIQPKNNSLLLKDTLPDKEGSIQKKDTLKLPKGVLYVVDGKQMDSSWSLEKAGISNRNIASVSVLKDEEAIRKYGSKGKNGVVVIETHPDEPKSPTKPVMPVPAKASKDKLKTKTPAISVKPATKVELSPKAEPKQATEAKPAQNIELNISGSIKGVTDVSPDLSLDLKAITIAADKITFHHKTKKLNLTGSVETPDSKGQVRLSMDLTHADKSKLLILDGKKLTLDKDVELKNRSFRLNELKSGDAVQKYGSEGINGAIEITSL